MPSERTKGHSLKLQQDKFWLDLRGKRANWVIKHWNGLPREPGKSPSLEVFNAEQDKVLSNLIYIQDQPYFEQDVGPDDPQRSFSTKINL